MANDITLFATKNMSVEQFPDSAWTGLAATGNSKSASYYRSIPWYNRGITLRNDAVASMPFEITNTAGEAIDTSDNYRNVVRFLPNPQRLLWLIEASLCLYGRAYLFSDNVGRMRSRLRYIIPDSVTPKIDAGTGEITFTRTVNGQPRPFTAQDIIYFWMPDPDVELGPPQSSPAMAAMNAAGVLYNIDAFASAFFEHGAIKATILGVKTGTMEAERVKLKAWFDAMLSGIRNAWRTHILNSDAVTVIPIGEGLESLQNTTLTREKREDIATALGIPHTMLFSDAANYATASEDDKHFYTKTIIPECEFIAGILNEQVFTPLGYHLNFLYSTLPALQQDEMKRSQSLVNLVKALESPTAEVAMTLLGYETDDAVLEQLRTIWAARAAIPPTPATQPILDQATDAVMMSELARWKRKSLNSLERGKSAYQPFDSDYISDDMMSRIETGLRNCNDAEAVKQVFANPNAIYVGRQDNAVMLDALRQAVEEYRNA